MTKAPIESMRRFENWRFGMFIHYGLYSLLGRHEWAICLERIPENDYKPLIKKFTAEHVDPRVWAQKAKQAGMRYMCLTSRHHEGFALFDTAMSTFNSMKSPAGRDIVREYTDACRATGLGVGIYYSFADWFDPGYLEGPAKNSPAWKHFLATVHGQLRELMSNYGTIDYLWYDGCSYSPETWNCAEINAEIRALQPGILISDRCGLDEDIKSAEGHTIGNPGKLWETCMTMNESWGWDYGDPDWKSARKIAMLLMTVAHHGGNLLLNVGPLADGSFPKKAESLLAAVGIWVKNNQAALFGTSPNPFHYADQKLSTYKGNTVYETLSHYHGPETVVAGMANKVVSVRVLSTGEKIAFKQEGCRLRLTGLPKKIPDPMLTVMVLELDGPPRGVPHPLLPNPPKL